MDPIGVFNPLTPIPWKELVIHCNICDRQLSEKEISWNSDLQTYEPCSTCLDVIMDAAYGQSRPDDEDEDQRFVVDSDFDQDQGDYADIYGNPSNLGYDKAEITYE